MNRSLRKLLALIFCAAVIMVIFAGCGNQPENQSGGKQSNNAPKSDVTLTFLIDNQSNMEGIQAVMDAFTEKTGVKFQIDLRPGGTEGDNVVKTRLATGEMDDICYYNSGSLFHALNPTEHFVDLSNEPYADKVDNAFKVCVSEDGKLYGIPSSSTQGGGILYNKKVYEELDLSVPETWDDFLANCETVKKAGKVPVVASFKDSWTAQVIMLADYYNVQAQVPAFADDYTSNKAKYADIPAALAGFEKIQELYKGGYYNEDFLTTTYETAQKLLAEGSGVHYPIITFVLANIEANYPEEVNDIGYFPIPSDDPDVRGITVWEPAGIYIYKNSKHIEEAKEFFEFFLSDEGVAIFLSKTKPQGPMAIKGITLPDNVYTAVKDMVPYFDNGQTAPALEFLSPIKGPNLEQICVQCGSGIKTPAENAAEYDKDVEKQAKQLGLQGW